MRQNGAQPLRFPLRGFRRQDYNGPPESPNQCHGGIRAFEHPDLPTQARPRAQAVEWHYSVFGVAGRRIIACVRRAPRVQRSRTNAHPKPHSNGTHGTASMPDCDRVTLAALDLTA
jgi:hypothetical protein